MASSVEEFISNVEEYADNAIAEAADAAEALESLSHLPYQTWISTSIDAMPSLSYAAPIDGTDEIPDLKLAEMNYNLDSYDPNLYKTAQYDSPFFKFVLPIIEDQIENGGVAISQSVQDALFYNMRERDLRTMQDALDVAESNVARRGFPLPSSLSQAARKEVIANYQETRDNRNREITALIAERAQQGMLTLIERGTTIEKAQMDFAQALSKVFLDVGNQIVQKFRAEQEAYTAEFEGKIKAILSKLEIEKMNQSIDLANNEQLLKQWELDANASLQRYKGSIDQAIAAGNQRVSAATNLVDFWAKAVASANSQLNAVVTQTYSADG